MARQGEFRGTWGKWRGDGAVAADISKTSAKYLLQNRDDSKSRLISIFMHGSCWGPGVRRRPRLCNSIYNANNFRQALWPFERRGESKEAERGEAAVPSLSWVTPHPVHPPVLAASPEGVCDARVILHSTKWKYFQKYTEYYFHFRQHKQIKDKEKKSIYFN